VRIRRASTPAPIDSERDRNFRLRSTTARRREALGLARVDRDEKQRSMVTPQVTCYLSHMGERSIAKIDERIDALDARIDEPFVVDSRWCVDPPGPCPRGPAFTHLRFGTD
jgi:hypothetical protein